VALLVLLAGAAFVGGRLLNQQTQIGRDNGPGLSGVSAGGQTTSIEIVKAKELPDTEPEVAGLFAERKDNSIFVTTGNGAFTVAVGEDGAVKTQTDGNTQKLEVVVTGETLVYKNVTQPPDPGSLPGDGKLQEKVAPGSLDDIGQNSFVSAWGERRGDRLIATVLMYAPIFAASPASSQ
jgi:hypothetical protein